MARLGLLLAVALASAAAQLSYVETSTGFQCNPELDGGRSELELADVNDDGHIDILSVGDHGSPYINTDEHGVMVWFGDGRGGWTLYQFGEFGYGGIAVGDVNNDGLEDVGYGIHHDYSSSDLGDQLIEVALGDGTGQNWTAWDDSLAQEGQNWGMFATDFGDIDNDGDLDVGSISFGADDGIHVYLNLGNGAWRRTFGFAGGNSRMEFHFRDVNRDGNADIIAAHGFGSVWFGDGSGGFEPANTGLPSSSYGLSGLSVGDADNDGGCDVAFANSSGGVEVFVWDEAGQMWRGFSGGLPGSGTFDVTALCDMNADGWTDLVAFGDGQLRVWTGDGAGNWSQAALLTTPPAGTYSAFRTGADFDHNGRPDIVLWAREGSWPSDINVAHAFREATPPESLGVFPVFPRGGEKFACGSVQFVDWWSAAPGAESTRVRLDLSLQGPGGPWTPVEESLRNDGRYQWVAPTGVTSPDCHFRYTVSGPAGQAQAVTPRPFAIGDTVTSVAAPRPDSVRREPGITPSPARGWVRLTGLTGPIDYELADAVGRRVRRGRVGQDGRVDLSALAAGVYAVRLRGSGASLRVVVRR
ncbi:MAG: VCBS repeat-containing protein [bacterium]